jgi:hypothetical protein
MIESVRYLVTLVTPKLSLTGKCVPSCPPAPLHPLPKN